MANQTHPVLACIDEQVEANYHKFEIAHIGLMAMDYLNGTESDYADLMAEALIDYPESRESLQATVNYALEADLDPLGCHELKDIIDPDATDRDKLVTTVRRFQDITDAEGRIRHQVEKVLNQLEQ